MKKLLLLPLTLLFLTPLAHADFPDVPATSEYHEAVSALEDLGVVKGYLDGTFKLDQPVQRDELLKMAYLAEAKHNLERRSWAVSKLFPFGKESTIKVDPLPFGDVKSTDWATPYIAWGKQQGLISGYPDGSFKSTKGVNFAEAAKMLVETSFYTNVRQGEHWAEGYIEILGMGMIPPSIQTADQVLTRGQVADLIYNYTLANDEALSERPSNVLIWENGKYLTFECLGVSGLIHYLKKDEEIYSRNILKPNMYEKLNNVDASTFKVYSFSEQIKKISPNQYVGAGVAMDALGVFDGAERIEGSAGASVEFFEDSFFDDGQGQVYGYAKDKEHAYLITCWDSCWIGIIPESDAESFEVLENGLSKDKNRSYYLATPLDVAISVENLEFLTPHLAKAGDKAYYFDALGEVKTLDYIGLVQQGFDGRLHYMTDGQKVFMLSEGKSSLNEVVGADANSFKLVPFGSDLLIALDDNALYEGASKIEGSAGGSFQKVGESFEVNPGGGFYGIDDEHAYLARCWEGCEISGILPNSDAATFTALEGGYAKDAHQAYFLNKVLPEVSATSFQSLNPSGENLYCQLPFAKDAETVFLREEPLPEIDAASFQFLDPSGFFFKDKTHIYRAKLEAKGDLCDSDTRQLIPEADLATFKALGTNHFGSKGKIYYVTRSGQVSEVMGADYDSFQPLYTSLSNSAAVKNIDYAKDKNHAYYLGKAIVGIDATTFTYDESLGKWKDKNGTYTWQDIYDMPQS